MSLHNAWNAITLKSSLPNIFMKQVNEAFSHDIASPILVYQTCFLGDDVYFYAKLSKGGSVQLFYTQGDEHWAPFIFCSIYYHLSIGNSSKRVRRLRYYSSRQENVRKNRQVHRPEKLCYISLFSLLHFSVVTCLKVQKRHENVYRQFGTFFRESKLCDFKIPLQAHLISS